MFQNDLENHCINISEISLRLLPTLAGALQEKNRMCASFNKIPTNYISVESLINVNVLFQDVSRGSKVCND